VEKAAAYLEWIMPVADILKEVDLVFSREQSGSNGMDGCIALLHALLIQPKIVFGSNSRHRTHPSFVVETTGFVKMFKELGVSV
jgi:hypothetical protein